MLDISFWLRFPLLLNHPAFVAAALEECKAAIRVSARQSSEIRLEEWKHRFAALANNPDSTAQDVEECAADFQRLSLWMEAETMRVLMRSLSFSYSTVRAAYKEIHKSDSFERIASLHRILSLASEHCREDKSKLRSAEYHALHKYGSYRLSLLVDKVLRELRKVVEESYPGDVSKLDEKSSRVAEVARA